MAGGYRVPLLSFSRVSVAAEAALIFASGQKSFAAKKGRLSFSVTLVTIVSSTPCDTASADADLEKK